MLNFGGVGCQMSFNTIKFSSMCNSLEFVILSYFILNCSRCFIPWTFDPTLSKSLAKISFPEKNPTFTGYFQEYIELYFLHGFYSLIIQPSNYTPAKTFAAETISNPRKRCVATTRKWLEHSWKACTTDAKLQTVFLLRAGLGTAWQLCFCCCFGGFYVWSVFVGAETPRRY